MGSGRLDRVRRDTPTRATCGTAAPSPAPCCSTGIAGASPSGRLPGLAMPANAVALAQPSIRGDSANVPPLPEKDETRNYGSGPDALLPCPGGAIAASCWLRRGTRYCCSPAGKQERRAVTSTLSRLVPSDSDAECRGLFCNPCASGIQAVRPRAGVVYHDPTSRRLLTRRASPPFAFEQVRALHLIAPRVWRGAGTPGRPRVGPASLVRRVCD